MPDRDFTFEIQEHFGVISSRDGWNKELNLVRWNGAAAKYDIREWDEHHEQMHRGITLTPWEMRNVVDLFVSRNNHAAVARGRAIEAGRNARRIAARQKAEETAAEMERQAELEALEGAAPPFEETSAVELTAEPAETQTQADVVSDQETPYDDGQEESQRDPQDAEF
ncbi:MAG: hypothetical protein IKI99_03450 [Firmicutes bacterium]|nr:hypothetical protein [Bacillota bacterium]